MSEERRRQLRTMVGWHLCVCANVALHLMGACCGIDACVTVDKEVGRILRKIIWQLFFLHSIEQICKIGNMFMCVRRPRAYAHSVVVRAFGSMCVRVSVYSLPFASTVRSRR